MKGLAAMRNVAVKLLFDIRAIFSAVRQSRTERFDVRRVKAFEDVVDIDFDDSLDFRRGRCHEMVA